MAQLLNQRYQFIQSLGVGSLGRTVLAGDTQKPGHPPCVLKELPLPSSNPKTLEFSLVLLKKKADHLRNVGKHPQIPQILDYFYEDQSFYLVEEYVQSTSLANKLADGQSLPPQQVIQLLQAVLPILDFIHQQGVIHRSLRPNSVLYRQSDQEIVLAGFGIFKEIHYQIFRQQGQSSPPLTNEVTAYIAPEQAIGKPIPTSDIYALGVIAMQALTGQTAQEIVQISTTPRETPWEKLWVESSSLLDVLKKMIHPSAGRRYQSATAVLNALEPLATLTHIATPKNGSLNGHHRNGKVQDEATLSGSESLSTSSPPEKRPPPPPRSPRSKRIRTKVQGPQVNEKDRNTDAIAASSPTPSSKPTPDTPSTHASEAPTDSPMRKTPTRLRMMGLGLLILFLTGGLLMYLRVPHKILGGYWLNQGLAQGEQGDWQTALESYNQALRWQPDNATLHYEKGKAHKSLEDRQAALDAFSTAIAKDPQLEEAHYQRANVRYSMGDYEGAATDFDAALAVNPDNIKAYVNRGNTQAALGNEPQALADYNQAIERDEDFAPAYLSRCLSRSNLDDHTGALEDCNRAINLRPTHTFAYLNRGLVRRRLNDHEGAIADYNIAIELDDQDPEPFYNRGLARQDLGDLPGAIADFSAALELDPEHLMVYYDRGQAHAESGDMTAAQQDLKEAAQRCLSEGRLICYQDAQQAIQSLTPVSPTPKSDE